VVVCADDFAISEGVSRGILQLAERGRLSATSAMTTRPHWRRRGRELLAFDGRLAVGLHLTLTLGAPLGPMPGLAPGGELPRYGALAAAAMARRLPQHEVEAEIARQIDAFADVFGRMPDFIDGHQHVHVLPGIRRALISVAMQKRLAGRLWLRDPGDGAAAIRRRGVAVAKALVIAGLAWGFRQAAQQAGFDTNEGFAGVSPFDPARDFAADFARFLAAPGRRHLVMCHPGEIDAELSKIDPVTATRPQELAFFLGERFDDICAAAGLRLATSWPG
jgi:chitin disaccharide deacetylase